ncbi:MAG: iron chelate uptake ABC transporter family permease subunit [Actinomycetota bacterium]
MTQVLQRPTSTDPANEELPLRGWVVRSRGISMRLDPRSFVVCSLLAAATVAVGCWSISVGDFPIPISDVIATVFGGGSEDADFIVRTLRLPRALTGALVGLAFGISGAIFQSLARNPLASPDIIGFNSGAAVGAVFVIVILGGSSSQVAFGAVSGGVITALLVFFLAIKGRGVQAYRLVLVGIGIGFAATAVVDYLITRAEIFDVQRAAVWLTGSLNGRSWDDVRTVGLALLVLTPLAVLMQRWLDRLELSDDVAAGLGVPVGRAKLALVLVGVALAALAVAAAGPIGFVAFVAGPIARRLVDTPGAALIPAGFTGALVTVAADLAARRVLAPTELPVGIATAVIGAPYLLWLLSRQGRTGAL